MSAQTRHIAIEVRVVGDEISGQAGDGMGQPTPFSGWLGLIAALDALINLGGAGWSWDSVSASPD